MNSKGKQLITAIGGEVPSNGADPIISMNIPYCVIVKIRGVADFLYHRWNCEEIEAKASAPKGSKAKRTDNLESYVYRCPNGELAIPGEHLRQSIINAARYKQDPRSTKKTAMDLYKAGVAVLTNFASVGQIHWDYEDRRRVVIQRSGISRTRPALKVGWEATFEILINLPEYITEAELCDTISTAGRLVGMGDFRPSYGRFQIIHFQRNE